MDEDEFTAAWDRILSKLDASERSLVQTVVAGAAVNHSTSCVLTGFLLGVLAGACVAGLCW